MRVLYLFYMHLCIQPRHQTKSGVIIYFTIADTKLMLAYLPVDVLISIYMHMNICKFVHKCL